MCVAIYLGVYVFSSVFSMIETIKKGQYAYVHTNV